MGVDYTAIKLLSLLKDDKKNKKLLTLGRQGLHINTNKVESLLELKKDSLKNEIWTEKLFNLLGYDIESIDNSNYENATHVHDMNFPIKENFKNKYDIVLDGGTLEHIFNFPVAIKNCMEMVKVGGKFASITCGNNFSGHGFYQFSPELFFRVFTKENGFEVENVFISEVGSNTWYKVMDPNVVKKRVLFNNKKETYIITIANKISNQEIFKNTPQQSDYFDIWNNGIKIKKRKFLRKVFEKINEKLIKIFYKYDPKHFIKYKLK